MKEEGRIKISTISAKLVEVNEERMNDFLSEQVQNNSKIQIKILGACLNLVQLHELLILIHRNREAFSSINPRIVSRTLKIFEIAPKLQILHRDKAGSIFVSLSELRYE